MMKAGKLSFLMAVLLTFASGKIFSQDLLVSGGNAVSTIICANGFVYTWGANTGGLLGNGSGLNPEPTPKQVTFPADPYFTFLGTGLTIKAVDAGSGAHFIALDCQGGGWSWGNNGGAIGITGTGSAAAQTSAPARVLNGETPGGAAIHASLTNYLVNVKYISGGNDNSYAIMNTGEAVGWGLNNNGQVGDGTTTNRNAPRYIRTADGLTLKNVIQIEAGDVTGYALVDPDGDGLGTVYSWGSGANSRLGRNAAGTANNGSESANDSWARPVLRANGTPLDNIKIISAGDVMCFAMDVDGYIWAWGNGGWGDCTGVGVSGLTHSDPRRVVAGEWGTTAGPGFGETYLKAKSISGGQGYGMAVTTNGIPVAWGNNAACGAAGGGNLGNGGGGQSGSPVFIRRSAGAYDNNVTSISDGDTWGFYTTTTNEIYAWGNNNVGQLGIGSITCQNYATQFLLPTCTFPAPKPTASLLPRDMSVCASAWTGTVLNSQFAIGTALDQDYRIIWSRNGTPVQTLTADQAGAATYNATSVGTYRVRVEYIGTDAPCTPYTPAEDEIDITAYTQAYTIPSGQTFCGALTPYVNGTGMYRWYANASGGTALDTTVLNNKAAIPKASANAPVAGVYTVYVEEAGLKAGEYGQVTPTVCASFNAAQDLWNTRNITFNVGSKNVILDTLSFYVRGETGAAQNYSWELNIYSTYVNNGHDVANTAAAGILYTSPIRTVTNPSNGGTSVLVKIPVNFTLTAGTSYAIGFKSNHNAKIVDFNCNYVGRVDNIAAGGPYMTSTGSERNTNWSNNWGSIANVHFHTAPTFCDRVPVTLTEVCPCAPPNSVALTPSTTTTYCQGAGLNIVGTTDLTALTPQNGAYYYRWYKGATALAAYSTTYADLSFASLVPGDAATYTLRVEDGTAGNSACYKEASVTIVVNATPVRGVVAANHTICNGNAANTLTSTTPGSGGNGTVNYQWQSSTDNISFANVASAGTSATYAPGALTQTTYFRRSFTAGTACPTVYSDTVTVTVNPALTAGSVDASQSICSSTSPNALTELTAATGGGGAGTYTYQWQSSANGSTGWTNIGSATAATYAPPTLSVTTYYRRVVSSGTCTAQNSNVITITVLPGLNAGTITATQSICYNTTPAALSSTAAATGGTGTYTYSWEESINSGANWSVIAGQSGLTYTPPTLTATTLYRRVVVSGTGTCNTANTNPVTITVYAALTVGSIGSDQPICSGVTPAALTSTLAPTGGSGSYGYVWEQSINGGGNWTTVGGAVGTGYAPPALTTTTMYRRVVTSGSCGSLTSTPVTITVTANVAKSVTINDPGATCAGAPMTFTATPVNGGGAPQYQWFLNGIASGGLTASNTYNSSTLVNGDRVEVVLSSSILCTTGNGNSNVVIVQVLSNVVPSLTISDPGKICTGTSVTFTITASSGGGASPTYQWSLNGAPVGTGTTSYTNAALTNGNTIRVVMTSSLGCAVPNTGTSNTVTMNVAAIPTPSILGVDTTFCSGLSVNYSSVNGGGTLTWKNNGNPVASGASINISSSGAYTLTEDNGACATTSAPVNVTVLPTPTVSAGPDIFVKEGDPVTLNGSGAVNYTWTPITGLSNANAANPTLTPNNSQEYTVIGYDATNKCFTTDVMKVFVEKLISIPNAFTPNSDNNNDGWEIANMESFPNCKVEVFNRWGNLVWKSTGYTMQWDGSNFRNGEALPDGTYFYVIDLQSKVFTEPYTGYVQIVK